MDLQRVDKKLLEAQYFLSKMAEVENRALDDKQPLDFCLSAFLSATRTVDYRLRKGNLSSTRRGGRDGITA